jgi:stage III sporulation protein AD
LALFLTFEVMTAVLSFIRSLSETAGISPAVLSIILKTVGISIVTKLSSDICRDAGQASLSSGVEFAGAVTAIYVALPLFRAVINMINSLI